MKTITLHHPKQDLAQLIAEINKKKQPIFIQEITGNDDRDLDF